VPYIIILVTFVLYIDVFSTEVYIFIADLSLLYLRRYLVQDSFVPEKLKIALLGENCCYSYRKSSPTYRKSILVSREY